MVELVKTVFQSTLKLLGDLNIELERAHRALTPKLKDSAAPPCSIRIRFLDFKVKQTILLQAWKGSLIKGNKFTPPSCTDSKSKYER